MLSRIKAVSVSNSSVQLVDRNPARLAIHFRCGNSAGTASVVVTPDVDASVSNGLPVAQTGGVLVIDGEAARRSFSAIRLAASDCIVGVVEIFDGSDEVLTV